MFNNEGACRDFPVLDILRGLSGEPVGAGSVFGVLWQEETFTMDPVHGSLEDLRLLLRELEARPLRVVLEGALEEAGHLAQEFAVDWNCLAVLCFADVDENHLGQRTFTLLLTSRNDSVLVFGIVPVRHVSKHNHQYNRMRQYTSDYGCASVPLPPLRKEKSWSESSGLEIHRILESRPEPRVCWRRATA